MPAKSAKSTPSKELNLTLGPASDKSEYHKLLMRKLATIRRDLQDLVVTGFDGTHDARCEGETFGFLASELLDYGGETGDIFDYAFDYEQPSIAVYDRTCLSMGYGVEHWVIVSREALLAVIRIK